MKIKISNKTSKFAKNNKMGIGPCGEGVIYINYHPDISNEKYLYLTAALISLLKEDNPSLMVTALAVVSTSARHDGAIVNFEEKS